MIREAAFTYADEYAAREEAQHSKGDGRSSIHYPALFLFVGEKCSEAAQGVLASCARKWDNADGVMALHALPGEPAKTGRPAAGADGTNKGDRRPGETAGRMRQVALPATAGREARSVRNEVHRAFYDDPGYVSEMNAVLRRLGNEIADFGRLYSSFDVIHLSVVTRVDDPLSVLLPEVTLLARAILGQSFKSVQTDLYVLIDERAQGESFGYGSAAGMAFLRELEGMQSSDYGFAAPLLVTEDGLSIPVSHGPGPLFDLVYVLSDKNERGMTVKGGMAANYDIISHISLLKNRVKAYGENGVTAGGYNNMTFKSGIRGAGGRPGYASAGFGAVRRPNRAIALAVLYHSLRLLGERLREQSSGGVREAASLLGLDAESLRERSRRLVPDASGLGDMTGLMSIGQPGWGELRRVTVREAEGMLYGNGGRDYFRGNFEAEAARRLAETDPGREWKAVLEEEGRNGRAPGFQQLALWTSDRAEQGGLLHGLRQHMAGLRHALEQSRSGLEQLYDDRVDRQPFPRVPLLDKRTIRHFAGYLFQTVYGLKHELLRMETELAFCGRLEAALERLHEEYAAKVKLLEQTEAELLEAARAGVREADNEIGQNIMEYYAVVTEEAFREIESKRGPGVWFTERFLGDMQALLSKGAEVLTERLIAVCTRELLETAPFAHAFEEELLRRANVAAAYDNRQVLTKEELFKRLYRSLEEDAVANVRLFDYTQEHRHEEKYFFGDSSSEFLRYAHSVDETTRIYRLGIVHEERRSGVEKLNLMGGFHLEDLLFYRNGKVYYETYIQNGYSLHGTGEDRLPGLR